MNANHTIFVAALAGTMTVGCGAAQPSQQLLDARAAYARAERSHARQLEPEHLLEANQALKQAERAHEDDAQSVYERHLAYIANRKALMAIARGDASHAHRETQLAKTQYIMESERQRQRAQADLASANQRLQDIRDDLGKVQSELASTSGELGDKRAALQQREAELIARMEQLQAEQKARSEVETERDALKQRLDAALESLKEIANVKAEERRLIITLSGAVLFATDKAELMSIAKDNLQRVADALKMVDEDRAITVVGHTDSVGTDQYNEDLSRRRAEAVREYLISEGIAADRVKAVGKGESAPVADNNSIEGRANNRRVEIIVEESPNQGSDSSTP